MFNCWMSRVVASWMAVLVDACINGCVELLDVSMYIIFFISTLTAFSPAGRPWRGGGAGGQLGSGGGSKGGRGGGAWCGEREEVGICS